MSFSIVHSSIWESVRKIAIASLEPVWRQNYDPDLPQSNHKGRQQSRDPKTATYALRLFGKVLLKRGKQDKPRLSQSDRINFALLKERVGEDQAEKILWGFEDDELS